MLSLERAERKRVTLRTGRASRRTERVARYGNPSFTYTIVRVPLHDSTLSSSKRQTDWQACPWTEPKPMVERARLEERDTVSRWSELPGPPTIQLTRLPLSLCLKQKGPLAIPLLLFGVLLVLCSIVDAHAQQRATFGTHTTLLLALAARFLRGARLASVQDGELALLGVETVC